MRSTISIAFDFIIAVPNAQEPCLEAWVSQVPKVVCPPPSMTYRPGYSIVRLADSPVLAVPSPADKKNMPFYSTHI